MCERGKLLFGDDFDKPLGTAWRTAKGKWEVVGGAIQGSELKSDMHGAVTRHGMKLHDAVIQYSFKLEGARATTFSLNDATGHCCRVLSGLTRFSALSSRAGLDAAISIRRESNCSRNIQTKRSRAVSKNCTLAPRCHDVRKS